MSLHPAIRPARWRPRTPAERALASWVSPLTARVYAAELAAIAALPEVSVDDVDRTARALVAALETTRARRAVVEARAEALRLEVTGAGPRAREVLVQHLRATVPTPGSLARDLAALDRDLDLDALLEREAGREEAEGVRAQVLAEALGGLYARAAGVDPAGAASSFHRSGAQGALVEGANQEPRAASRRAAVAALAEATAALSLAAAPPDPSGLRTLQRIVRAANDSPWVRRAALGVVVGLEPKIARHWLTEALATTSGREPFLLRARAVELTHTQGSWALSALVAVLDDPSELVRATAVDTLFEAWRQGKDADPLRAQALLTRVQRDDPEARVRARVADRLARVGVEGAALLVHALGDVPLVASFALESALAIAQRGFALPDAVLDAVALCGARGPAPIARQASLVQAAHRAAQGSAAALAQELGALPPQGRRAVDLPPDLSPLALAQALVPQAARGFGFHLDVRGDPTQPGGRVLVSRGDLPRPALWRFLHELRRPGPVKRQGHDHTLGQADQGAIRVPPGGLAEESPTGVPGQRVYVEREGSWGPELPAVTDLAHALRRGAVWIAHPGGVTEVQATGSRGARLGAGAALAWRFQELDERRLHDLREGRSQPGAEEGRYSGAARQLGLRWGRVSSAMWAGRALPDPVAYLVDMGANTLIHLIIGVLILGLLLFGRVAWVRQQVRRARAQLPLVLGGWGTRGKSGTERLKAGLIEGLGLPYFSKTTGCEAMFLHGPPGGHAREMFLFRPYEKATIWEQTDVIRLAHRLGSRVFLWECMGLNPIYVRMLQRGWTQDDLSTLTNAYPDHEDIQGPTGLDVAQTLSEFCPENALFLSTEENMRPLLASAAARAGSTFVPVLRSQHALLPQDLLARIPYLEHPANVALAAEVGASLGVPQVEAIGWMAEHVVPDLGALVVYPRAWHMAREVEFANGMSANDRLSWLNSWRRSGFADPYPGPNPARWMVTVVNNREDRVARSQIFASILALDATAHRHVLIGTNVRGLAGYLERAVEERLAAAAEGEDARGRTLALFAHLRLPEPGVFGEACARRLGASESAGLAWRQKVAWVLHAAAPTLEAGRALAEEARDAARALVAATRDPASAAELEPHLLECLARYRAVDAATNAPLPAIQALYRALVQASLVVLDDPRLTGDQVMARAIATAPPGAEVRIIGMQNIKGTGLDFAYQWVYWRELHQALRTLTEPGPHADRRRALAAAEANPLGSALACEALIDALQPLAQDGDLGPRVRALLQRASARRSALLADRARETPQAATLRAQVLGSLERVLDPLDAIYRRRRAWRVLDDLVDQRISHPRASVLLRQLMERHKGGWLGGGKGAPKG